MASSAHDGSNLFKIRRIFGFPSSPADGDVSSAELPALQIASMAVHTLEKKQLLALAISEESSPASIPGDNTVSVAPGTAAIAPAAAKTNFLLLRTIEEDQRARFWRFPVCSTPKQQQAGKAERLTALEFSPEGDWLAALSSRKNRLHLLPVLTLIARQRRALLDATYQPTSHLRELMSVHQAAMTTQMASYLRATNEYGGLNGARYHSQVAGDDEQMSTLEFAPGIGRVTCVRWWRSLNGKNYCLVGGTESLVSIVNVEENAEECRCELANAGAIVSIDLLHENFRKERRTSMLVKTKSEDVDEKEMEAGGTGLRYYRVVLEKKFQPKPKASPRKADSRQNEKPTTPVSGSDSGLTIVTTTGGSSSSGETTFTTSGAAGSGLMSPFTVSKPPQFVVKTFPQHFLEDLDFRPQRIKKNSPHVCMYAINGMLSSESSLALYDCKKRKANLYSNFHWRLKSEYQVPDLLPSAPTDSSQEQEAEDVVDVDLTYCSTDLMLLQGRSAASNETISTWVSLPSHQGMDEDVVTAHIVHYLTLHGNERIERVVQSTARSQAVSGASVGGSQSNEAEIIYILQTKHHVYECRPQWSRLALFKALCGRSIALRDALSIGYALGIDMASLCQVVANTLYTSVIDGSATADPPFVQWVRELFEVSRAMPSSAVEQLTAIGGVQNAIDYAQHVLSKPVRDSFDDSGERRRVALLLVDLVLQQQLQKDPSLAVDGGQTSTLRDPQQTDDEREAWLVAFLETNQDYLTTDIVDLCLSQQHVDKALLVATRRQEVPQVLEKIVQVGLASFVSEKAMRSLLASGHASALTAPSSRLILRSFPVEVQAEILLAHPPAILQHRGWLERNLPAISLPLCQQLAASIDPTQPNSADLTASATAKCCPTAKPSVHSDIATSEFISVAPEEQLELFLTLLLRLNSQGEGEYSQARLETLLKDLAAQYRPPIMVSRCVDYENWTAAACIYEAHGELVEALECRLHSHKTRRSSSLSSPMAAPASDGSVTRRRQYSDDSVSSARSDESEFHEEMREELLSLLNSLVVQSHSTKAISEQVRAAILARLLVKWFDYGLKRTVLEVFLIDPNVFVHVSSLLAQIFFSEVVDSILGVESFAGGPVTSSNGSGGGFDDRDREWVRQCHRLPFSGQFLFHVCVSFLEKDHAMAKEASTASRSSQSSTLKLLELVKSNAVQNDLSHPAVAISPHSAQALGKADPLETHVKAFTCGHLFPKRMFEEELLPEFDKRMNALPLPLFATKQAFAHEFKRSASETPCPICSFNKISERVYEQRQSSSKRSEPEESATAKKVRSKTEQSTRRPRLKQPGATPYYFLHREAHERLAFSSSLSAADLKNRKPLQHEAWEWREQHAP